MSKVKLYINYYKLCSKRFGVLKGLLIFIKIKHGKSGKINLPGYKSPIYLRPKNHYDSYTFQEIFLQEDYDVDISEVSVIIDAGANIGLSSCYFANKFPNATIICLEPDMENCAILRQNTENYTNVHILENALWNKNEDVVITNPDAGKRGFMIGNATDESSIILKGITIQSIIEKFKIRQIDIFKIDIEGAEKEVFAENTNDWLSITRLMFVELHDRMKKGTSQSVFKAVSSHDFIFEMKGENLIFTKD